MTSYLRRLLARLVKRSLCLRRCFACSVAPAVARILLVAKNLYHSLNLCRISQLRELDDAALSWFACRFLIRHDWTTHTRTHMKAFALLIAALVLFTATPVSSAAVAVWKGAGKQTLTSTDKTVSVTIYFILDLTTFAGRTVIAIPSAKQFYDEGERSYGLNQAATQPKGTLILSDAIAIEQNSAIEFNHQIALARGKTSTVFTGPQNTGPLQLPKIFKYLLSKGAGGIFVQIASLVEGQLSYDKNRTQSANAVGKSVLTVSEEIQAELISGKAYTEITAP